MTAADGFAVESLFGSWDDRPEKYFYKKGDRTMTRNIDEMISERENEVMDNSYGTTSDGRFEITVTNKGSNLSGTILVHPEHTLKEILAICEDVIAVRGTDGKVIFENIRTKKSSSDLQMTVGDFGILPGDELLINGDGKVA